MSAVPVELPVELGVVVEEVRERLADRPGALTAHRVADALRSTGRPVGDATVLAVHEELRRDVLGAGPLEPLLRLPGVTDVVVNGTDGVYVDTGEGLRPAEVRFADEAAVRRLAQRLAALRGRRLDDASPFVDVRLADGTRCHALLAPIARPGTLISLRVPRVRGFTLTELVAAGAVSTAGEWRDGFGQDDPACRTALVGRPGGATGGGRGLPRAVARPPPLRVARGSAAQPRRRW